MWRLVIAIALFCLTPHDGLGQKMGAANPVIFADVPDMSMIRVGKTYYMSSTTMHMSPGLPVMKSDDLINWHLVSYGYDTLASVDALNLANGKNAYGRGSWASSLRFHNGIYYVTTFAQTTNKTYIFSTSDIESGRWNSVSFSPAYHDHSLFFDDDGRAFMVYGGGTIRMFELNDHLSGPRGTGEKVIIENASAPAGTQIALPAEGSQLFKVNGWYYLFNIVWPRDGMRTVLVHRARKIDGPYEGKVVLQDRGIAQGGLIDTPEGHWYAYLFRDYGAVGRIPYLATVTWADGWPVIGTDAKVSDELPLPASRGLIPGIVNSDEFDRRPGERPIPLAWQWNHNPNPDQWSLSERKGFLRLKTWRVDSSMVTARNMLTQRTFGPRCSAETSVEAGGLMAGDFAGIGLLQKNYGFIGVRSTKAGKVVVVVNAETGTPEEEVLELLSGDRVFFRIECDFRDMKDEAKFFYSLDGKNWKESGRTLHMKYTLPHFMGYRFGLFAMSTSDPRGWADFDYYRIKNIP